MRHLLAGLLGIFPGIRPAPTRLPISQALYPEGGLQERLHGAAYYFARHGFDLAEEFVGLAADPCPGHRVLWL